MNRKRLSRLRSTLATALLASCLLPLVSGCSELEADTTSRQNNDTALQDSTANTDLANSAQQPVFETIEWESLIHPDDLEVLLSPPEYLSDVEDGSFEDQISNQMRNAIEQANDDPYQQALVSTRVVEGMDGKNIRLPGFIVPLEFDDHQVITQFFLVPFFGACIHVPPPPPNQIILVNAPQGLTLDALYDPFWVSGVLHAGLTENDVATSAYTMEMDSFEAYTEL